MNKQQANTSQAYINLQNIFKMTKTLQLVLLLIILVSSKLRLQDKVKQVQKDHKTMVESDHFYSNHQTKTHYDVDQVEKGKALVVVLKNKEDKQDRILQENPITITLEEGPQKSTCTFNSFEGLCVLENVTTTAVKMTMQCKQTPCELSWEIIQPGHQDDDGVSTIEKLESVNGIAKHAMLVATCNNKDLKNFGDNLKLYTDSSYEKVSQLGMTYFLFSNEKKGHCYLTTDDQATKSCVRTMKKHIPDELQFSTTSKREDAIQDFLHEQQFSVYKFDKVPTTDFRIDCTAHVLGDQTFNNNSGLIMKLIGTNDKGQKQGITKLHFDVDNQKNFFDFSLVFKKLTGFKDLELEVKSKGGMLMITYSFIASDTQEISLGESTFFELKKGEKINYKIVPQTQETDASKKLHIFLSDAKKIKTSKNECTIKEGCTFEVEALEEVKGSLYIGQSQKEDMTEVNAIDVGNKITKYLKEGERADFNYAMKAKQAIQLVVNSPSVIVYTAPESKCKKVNEKCYVQVLNYHFPIIYEPEKDENLLIEVQSLDNVEFAIDIIQENGEFVSLVDSVPFTYLMDDKQSQMVFSFTINSKVDTHFNLIAPVNEMSLSVINDKQLTQNSIGDISNEGYITFTKSQIGGLDFVIKVEKKEGFKDKYIHFTIIASTQYSSMRLEPSVAHYQTMSPSDTRIFMFEYEPKKDVMINFYTHNIQSGISIELGVTNSNNLQTKDSQKDKDKYMTFTIDKPSDVLNLKDVTEVLCAEEEGENCEIYFRITNKMSQELDLTITLLVQDAVIELKDGVWQNYYITKVSETTHFYFIPTHKNKSVTLLYHSSMMDLKIVYKLWRNDAIEVSADEWPFPVNVDASKHAVAGFKPTKYVHIDAKTLEICWPRCVVLISLTKDETSLKNEFQNFLQYQTFKIMASNNLIELPEKSKVDVVLNKDEEKHILIDLKYVLDKQALTFFTYNTLGSVIQKGNVYSETNPRCPTIEEMSDFSFGNVETQISVPTIKAKMAENSMQNDKNIYICILAKAFLDSKFAIEYTTEDDIIKQIMLDSFYTTSVKAGSSSLMQVDASQQFYVKVSRETGFPFISYVICKEDKTDDDINNCLSEFKDKTEKEHQLLDKMLIIEEPPCTKCIFFMKIMSDEATKITIHVQSKYSQTELQAGQIITDELTKSQQNRYDITTARTQEVNINIDILHGDLNVQLNNFNDISVKKSNTKGSKNIHITIPSKASSIEKDSIGKQLMGVYGLSSFDHLHLTVDSQDHNVEAMYTIVYTSGQTEIMLQDGLITEYAFSPKKTTRFYYKSPSISSIYLHLSASTPAVLSNMKVKMLSLQDKSDEDSGVEMTPEKADFKKKTPNPTMIMKLPPNKFFLIEITNQNSQVELLTIGINNQQIMYLPFDHVFPFQLNPSEYLYIVLNVRAEGYVKVLFSKCDQSIPTIAYTLDYDEFQKEEFSYEETVEDDLIFERNIKIKKSGAVYMKVKSPDDDRTIMTVKAIYSPTKIKDEKPKAGDKGQIQYQLLDSTRAELTFTSLVCGSANKNCNKNFAYTSLSSDKIENLYSQLACPSVAFDLEDVKVLKAVETSSIASSKAKNNKISFTQAIKGDVEYVGVKAVNTQTEEVVFYKPVEIATFWGQLSKGSQSSFFLITLLVIIFVCCGLIAYRRYFGPGKIGEGGPGGWGRLDSIED